VKLEFYEGKAIGVVCRHDGLEGCGHRADRTESHRQRGDEAAKLETGLRFRCRPFVNTGDTVKVDTSEARYVQRM